MASRYRPLVLLLAAACALVACGDDGVDGSSVTSAFATETTASATTVPATVAPPPTEAAEFPRTVSGAAGDVEIPARPERVIATGAQVDLDSVVVLGIEPVAAGTFFGTPPPWLADAVGDAVLFDVNDTNLEQVAELGPDLIIGPADVLEPLADRLGELAPTLLVDTAVPWRTNLETIARATGREAEAAAFLAEFDDAVETARADAQPYGETTVSAITVGPDGSVLALAARSSIGEALALLGVPRVEGQDADTEFIPIAEELLGSLDGHLIFVYHSPFLATQWEELSTSAVWQSIPAVADGRVVVSTGSQWFFATPQAVRIAVETVVGEVLEPGVGDGG
ncbi:MAG: ABC transporter substrate-binding protein [Actinomycetota bacterium]